MKKNILLLLAIIISFSINAQNVRRASHSDSVKAHAYWDSANHSWLYSQQRQLYLDSALAILPGYAWWWQQKSMPVVKQHKYELAIQYLDSAVKYDKDQYLDYRAYTKCVEQKDYVGALRDFAAARALHGNSGVMDHSYDFYTGLCYLQLNQFDSAGYYISKSIEQVRKKLGDSWVNSTEWFYMGIVQFEKEDFNTAIESFDNAIKIYKNFSDAKYYKAECYMHMKRPKEALPWMLEADSDFKQGYSIIEDDALYEIFPYQINQKYYLNNALKYLQTAVKG